jgi:hypothetical protein
MYIYKNVLMDSLSEIRSNKSVRVTNYKIDVEGSHHPQGKPQNYLARKPSKTL